MGEIGEGWASMASGRDRQWLTRSAEAEQQWPWARLAVARDFSLVFVAGGLHGGWLSR